MNSTSLDNSHNSQPSNVEELASPLLDYVEQLDDIIFEAINGDPVALNEAADAWQAALAELDAATIAECRSQYLRRARYLWRRFHGQPNQPLHKLFAAMEVISIVRES